MFIIAGLGNPDKIYKNNRHNVGFLFIDYLIKNQNLSDLKKKDNFLYSKNIYNNIDICLIKPITYMNLSGEAIISSTNFFKVDKQNIVIIYDDVDLPFSKIRIRESGSSGGHNGLKSIEHHLGSKDYMRIRIGIGNREDNLTKDSSTENNSTKDDSVIFDLKHYVLSDFSDEELEILNRDIFSKVDESLNFIINNNIKGAMNRFNGTKYP